jgi:hypothetical protein
METMNRSTLRSVSSVLATAVIALSFSPLAASAQTLPVTGPAANQARTIDIVYGDGDEGAIFVGPISVTSRPASIALAPGDILFGDQDQGAIAAGPVVVTAASPVEADPPAADQDMIFTGDDGGGSPVNLTAFRGRSNITMAELESGNANSAASVVDAYQPGDGCE